MKSWWLTVCLLVAIAFLGITEAKPDEPDKELRPASDPMIGNDAGQARDDNGLNTSLIWCPPGFVTMEGVENITREPAGKDITPKNRQIGSKTKAEPRPQNTIQFAPAKVVLTQGYWLGKFEMTQAEWKEVMNTEPWKGERFAKEGADFPATFVTWSDACEFCRKLTTNERQAGRLPTDWEYTLPTEAQWERACRARTETRFSFGEDESKLGDYAWSRENAYSAREDYAHEVGQKKANPWGLFDMHGNVWEWCRDAHTVTLPGGRDPEVKPGKGDDDAPRVIRGGGWGTVAVRCRSASRNGSLPSSRNDDLGFRIALSRVR